MDILTTYLQKLLGDEYPLFLSAQTEPPCIRVNTIKSSVDQILDLLQRYDVPHRPHPFNPYGFIIEDDHLPLSHSLAFFLGHFFYQSMASQLPALALDPRPGETVLDIAAAPGSKSTQIAALMQNQGRLVLNDASFRRHQALMTNLFRAGVWNEALYFTPGQRIGKILPEYFDRVLVDAPCFGLNHPPKRTDNKAYWSMRQLEGLINIQYHLLVSAIKAVRVGGSIVYSTCSMTVEENERLIDRILKEYPVEVEELPLWQGSSVRKGIVEFDGSKFHDSLQKAIRIMPFPEPVEGFFVVRLKKTESVPKRPIGRKLTFQKLKDDCDQEIATILNKIYERWGLNLIGRNFKFLRTKRRLWLVNSDWEAIPAESFTMAGLPLAENKGREWKLTNASVQMFGDEINKSKIELPEQQLKELFREQKLLVTGMRNGYYILQYQSRATAIVSVVDGVLKTSIPHSFHLVL